MDHEEAAFPDGLKPFDLPAAANADTTRLVWDFGGDSGNDKKGHVKIYLKSLTDDESATHREENGVKDEEQAQSTGSNGQGDGDANSNTPRTTATNNEETIEASVLQYQRQQRKIQAAKRAGAELTEDQLEIVFEDDSLVVVNKPAGVLTVPGIHNNDSIANLLFQRLQHQVDGKKDSILCPDAPSMTVHRLDMDTSGLVCFGKTKSIVSTLHQVFRRETDDNNNNNKKKRNKNRKRKNHPKPGEQAREDGVSTQSGSIEDDPQADNAIPHTVVKEYEALVCGHLPPAIDSGHIDLPLQRDVHHPPFMRVSTPHSESLARQVVDALRARNWTKLSKRNPKPSQTLFRVVAREYYKDKTTAGNDGTDPSCKIPVTRLAMTPITGRTHQLRVHCAAMGFPIVGDPVYGLYGESAFCGGLFHNPVELLHATKDNNQEEQGWRAPISLQKQIMEVHPPGVKDMCLHAKKLGFPHPVTKDMRHWEVAPKF